MKTYSKKERAHALKLHREGWGYRRIALHMGCAESTVKKWVERAGQPKHAKPNHNPSKRKAAVAFYAKSADATIASVSKKYSVHPKTLSRWLIQDGVEIRARKAKFSRDDILKDIRAGMSGAAIARKHNCSESYVSALRNGRL